MFVLSVWFCLPALSRHDHVFNCHGPPGGQDLMNDSPWINALAGGMTNISMNMVASASFMPTGSPALFKNPCHWRIF